MKKIILAGVLSGLFVSTSAFATCTENQSKVPTVLEVVNFQLAEGVNDEAFVKAASALEKSFLCEASGFVRRTLTKREDGTWLDVVEWETMDDALSAMKAIEADVSAAPFMQSINFESVKLNHWKLASETN